MVELNLELVDHIETLFKTDKEIDSLKVISNTPSYDSQELRGESMVTVVKYDMTRVTFVLKSPNGIYSINKIPGHQKNQVFEIIKENFKGKEGELKLRLESSFG